MISEPESAAPASVTHLVGGILADAQDLIRQQLTLFRHEIHTEIHTAREAGFVMAVGVVIAVLGGALICLMAVHGLAWAVPELPLWSCYGIVGAPVALIGGGLYLAGLRRLKSLNPPFEQSVQSLKENVREPIRTLKESTHG